MSNRTLITLGLLAQLALLGLAVTGVVVNLRAGNAQVAIMAGGNVAIGCLFVWFTLRLRKRTVAR